MIPSYLQIERIHRAAMDTESWDELERRAFDKDDPLLSGRKFQSDKELFTLAVAGAHTLITGEYRTNRPCPIDFPATSVKNDNIAYYIYGILHDKTNKRVVRERLSGLENAIIESDLSIYYPSRAIGHPREHELKYVSLADLGLMLCRPGIWISQLRDIFSFLARQKDIKDVLAYRCIDMQMDDGTTRGYDISAVTLPKHLEHSWLEHHLSCAFDRACLLRSLAQTEYAISMAQRMSVWDMHAIVGLAHERQIAYFLENPDRAEEIRLRYAPTALTRAMRRSRSTSAMMAACTLGNGDHLVDSSRYFFANGGNLTYTNIGSFAATTFITGFSAAMLTRLYWHVFTNKRYVKSFLPWAK